MDTLAHHPNTVHLRSQEPASEQPPLPAAGPRHLTVAGHELTIFVESAPLIDAMVRDIHAAKTRIWLEVYTFFSDDAGKRIAAALEAKAKEGLDVRVLYDAVGSVTTPWTFFSQLAKSGAQVHAFHSLLEGLRRFRPFRLLRFLNRRDHRKLLVIDDGVGYFGGMNLIDTVESVAEQKARNQPTSSGWRDVHVRMAGPQVAELAESYDRSWRRAHGQEIPRRTRAYRRAAAARILAAPAIAMPVPESIHFFDSGPGRKFSRAARVFDHLIRGARRHIILSMAYFLPTGRVLRALQQSRRRGVKIRVIVPGKSDVKLVQRATSCLYDRLIRRGFRVYERRQQMLHSKVMVIDDAYTLVGSCNLDPRSLYINLEFLAVIRSPNLAAVMTDICHFEIQHSQRITLERCRQVPWWQRALNRCAWTLRWWL